MKQFHYSVSWLISAMALAMVNPSAWAGESLRLQSGIISIQDETQALLLQSLDFGSESGYFVVQFTGRIPATAADDLAHAGAKVLRYLPDDAYVVRARSEDAARLRGLIPSIRAVATYSPEWKISRGMNALGGTRSAERTFLLTAFDEEGAIQMARSLGAIPGIRFHAASSKDFLILSSFATLQQISEIPGVEWIQEAPVFVTLDFIVNSSDVSISAGEYTGHESGTQIMNFEAAWNRGFAGEGQIVGVADTGLDTGDFAGVHRDFAGNLLRGYATGLGSKSWGDPIGHGTHVAGSVCGNGAASDTKIRGGAYQSKLVAQGLWSDILNNLAPGSDMEKLFGTSYREGARVHTNSWGSPVLLGKYDSFASKVDEYMWTHPDLLILFAAGNSGQDVDGDGRIDPNSIGSPATAKNILTVGASENEIASGGIQKKLSELRDGTKKWGVEPLSSDRLSDNRSGIAAFSSRGPTEDGRIKPEIVAPGTNIVSVKSRHPKAGNLWGDFNTDYVWAGGTSMATPLTAGAAAVAREFLIKSRKIQSPSAAVVKATLMHTATELFPGQYGMGPKQELPSRRPNIHEGYGRVDMDLATSLGDETSVIDQQTGVGLNEESAMSIVVKEGGSLRATLTYTDAPGAPSAAKNLVNDLDLRVISPKGEIHQLADRTNNSEMIELSGLAAGEYRVVVSGINVPNGKSGKQPFALLVTTDSR